MLFICLLCMSYEIFFFSSRRRHTRLQGDWSSDVCSSDLLERRPGKRLRRGYRDFFQFSRPALEIRAIATVALRERDRKSVVEGKSVGADRERSTEKKSERTVICREDCVEGMG